MSVHSPCPEQCSEIAIARITNFLKAYCGLGDAAQINPRSTLLGTHRLQNPEHCVAGDQERLAQEGRSITDVAFVERSRIGPVSHFGQPSRPLEYRLAVKKEARNSTGV